MASAVETTRDGFICEIRFAAPPYNFASVELITKIADAVDAADANPGIRCSVLTAAGTSFCAGADLFGDEKLQGDSGIEQIRALYGQALRLFQRKKPLIAAVQGPAIGAGLGIALSADFRVASPAARFAANFVRLGFHPGFGISASLPRVIGSTNAGWMLLSGERVKAERALEWGLIDKLAEPSDLLETSRDMARAIAANAPLALVAVRATWLQGFAAEVAVALEREIEQQALLRKTADYAEGVAAAFSRREPDFVGR